MNIKFCKPLPILSEFIAKKYYHHHEKFLVISLSHRIQQRTKRISQKAPIDNKRHILYTYRHTLKKNEKCNAPTYHLIISFSADAQ
ncbi:hypothetical protein BpHYR1_023125 [Brachionus plicatilis]|uniref:Uncharacterized protein n=1 Tax=Brachionus plicatilis TaxID=10195 RepID=A0A3M7QP07_BRAPC|nr:hypothetical protein BpHYR1_023125 [Brachionus plicatilis]